jgi:hypothetical protein
MKTTLVVMALVCAFLGGACSRKDETAEAAKATPAPNLKADAERLQQATAKAAEERRRASESPTGTPSQN